MKQLFRLQCTKSGSSISQGQSVIVPFLPSKESVPSKYKSKEIGVKLISHWGLP